MTIIQLRHLLPKVLREEVCPSCKGSRKNDAGESCSRCNGVGKLDQFGDAYRSDECSSCKETAYGDNLKSRQIARDRENAVRAAAGKSPLKTHNPNKKMYVPAAERRKQADEKRNREWERNARLNPPDDIDYWASVAARKQKTDETETRKHTIHWTDLNGKVHTRIVKAASGQDALNQFPGFQPTGKVNTGGKTGNVKQVTSGEGVMPEASGRMQAKDKRKKIIPAYAAETDLDARIAAKIAAYRAKKTNAATPQKEYVSGSAGGGVTKSPSPRIRKSFYDKTKVNTEPARQLSPEEIAAYLQTTQKECSSCGSAMAQGSPGAEIATPKAFARKKKQDEAKATKKPAPKAEDPNKKAERNRKARERHWGNTGVSSSTIKWMKDNGML